MRKTMLFAGVALLALGLATPAFAGKVGFVDLQKIMDLTRTGQDFKKQLAAKSDELTIAGKKKDLEFRSMVDAYKKSEAALADAAKQSKQEELQKKYQEMAQFQQQAMEEMTAFKLDGMKKIFAKIKEITQKLAASGGYDIILLKADDEATESSFVLYGASSVDLTDLVVRQMNP